jgi:hypothetical protein
MKRGEFGGVRDVRMWKLNLEMTIWECGFITTIIWV